MSDEAPVQVKPKKRRRRRQTQQLPIKVTVKPVSGKSYTFFAFKKALNAGVYSFILPSDQVGSLVSRSIAVQNVASIDVEESVINLQHGAGDAVFPPPQPPFQSQATHAEPPRYQAAPRPVLTSRVTPLGPQSLVEDGSGGVSVVNAGFMMDPSTGSM